MKEIAFNTKISLNFPHVCNSLLVADVDNDGTQEVVAGSRDGRLAIFKLQHEDVSGVNGIPPYRTASKLGLISALAVGDLFNRNFTLLTVISADGACHVFRVAANKSDVQLFLSQPLQSNIKAAQIVDVDGDFYQELVVGLTDRVVRTYRYMADNDSPASDSSGACLGGHLVALNKWESPALITALSHSFVPPGNRNGVCLILSQTDKKFVILEPKLGTDLEIAGDSSTVDRSVRFCQADTDDDSAKGKRRSSSTTPEEDPDSRSSDYSPVIFVAKNADYICMFHQPVKEVCLVNDSMVSTKVDFSFKLPTFVFNISRLTAPGVALTSGHGSDQSQSNRKNGSTNVVEENPSKTLSQHRFFAACDWAGNIYLLDPSNESSDDDSELLVLSAKDSGNLNCFSICLGQTELQECALRCIVATSTTKGRLFVYTLPWCKLEKYISSTTTV